jgi:hypothetical protein
MRSESRYALGSVQRRATAGRGCIWQRLFTHTACNCQLVDKRFVEEVNEDHFYIFIAAAIIK